jgi:hypothetical protein
MIWPVAMATRGPHRRVVVGPNTNIHPEPEGWSVRVCRRGHVFSGYFGDAVYGCRRQSLLAARHYRDDILQRVEPDTRVRRAVPRGAKSKTGVVGVTREPHVVDGRVYYRYVAGWIDVERGYLRRRFLVQRYGHAKAKALAVAARRAGVAHSPAGEAA